MNDERQRLLAAFARTGRESSRLSVLFRSVVAARLGLTVSEGECLDFLLEAGEASAGQLARQTNLTTGAITSLIRRLHRAGYVTSERDPADRRRVIVKPVPEKLTEAAGLYEAFGEQMDEVLSRYTDAEVVFLTRHHERMRAIYLAQIETIPTGDQPLRGGDEAPPRDT